MRAGVRHGLLAATLGLVAGSGACAQGGPLDGATVMQRMATLAERGDTMALARLAEQACRGLRQDDHRTCLEDYFLTLADGGRIRLSLGALSALASRHRQVEADGHSYTHVIGIRAWEPGQDVAEVFSSCTGLFQSGCYHGVIQSWLTANLTAEGGLDSAAVVALCDRIGARDDSRWLRFQCVHGLGHGLEMSYNWDLPRALEGCDWLHNTWDRESCYGGAFMENAVASMPGGGHHTSARALAEVSTGDPDDHGAHTHHGAPDLAAVTFRMRDSADPLYPCSAVADQYQRACYMLQGGIILQGLDFDFGKAAAQCDRVPQSLRTLCYVSLGTNASGVTVQNTRRAIGYCLEGDPGYQPWCIVGVVKNYIDVTAQPRDGIAFCREVPAGRNKRQCYVAVGEQISVLHADPGRRERECAAVTEDLEACRYGAGLLSAAPEGLPVIPGER